MAMVVVCRARVVLIVWLRTTFIPNENLHYLKCKVVSPKLQNHSRISSWCSPLHKVIIPRRTLECLASCVAWR